MTIVPELRWYQLRAKTEIFAAIKAGTRRIMVCSPTGSGKGTLIAWLLWQAWKQGKRGMVTVHNREIVKDLYKRLTEQFGCTSVGVICASLSRKDYPRNPNAMIQVCSTDSLSRAVPRADLAIIDEAHRSMNASSMKILTPYRDNNTIVLGFTATPTRLDRKDFRIFWQLLIVAAQPSELFPNEKNPRGYIVKPTLYGVDPSMLPNTDGIRMVRGDYDQAAIGEEMCRPKLVGHIPEQWLKYAEGRQTVAFAVHIKHSRLIVEAFRKVGVHAEHVDGTMGAKERDDIIGRFEGRQFPVLSQCRLFIEGIDIKAIKGIIAANPTQSLTINLQECGRASRPSGEESAMILDHAGNHLVHGYPWMDRDWHALWNEDPPSRRGAKTGAVPMRKCKKCGVPNKMTTDVCVSCGEPFTSEDKIPETIDGDLVKIDGGPESKIEFWRKHCRIAHDRGYDRAWVAAKYRAHWLEEPDATWELGEKPVVTYTQEQKDKERARLFVVARHTRRDVGWVAEQYRIKFGEAMVTRKPVTETPEATHTETEMDL